MIKWVITNKLKIRFGMQFQFGAKVLNKRQRKYTQVKRELWGNPGFLSENHAEIAYRCFGLMKFFVVWSIFLITTPFILKMTIIPRWWEILIPILAILSSIIILSIFITARIIIIIPPVIIPNHYSIACPNNFGYHTFPPPDTYCWTCYGYLGNHFQYKFVV